MMLLLPLVDFFPVALTPLMMITFYLREGSG
jgi:hypothetical protein